MFCNYLLWIEVASQGEETANEMGLILLCMYKLQGYSLSSSMFWTDLLVLSPNVYYSVMINVLERTCCSELFLTHLLFVCLSWKCFCLVSCFREFLTKKQRKLSFLVAFFTRYESVWIHRKIVFWLDLKNLLYLLFKVKCLSKTFQKSDSLTCTFMRSLLQFFSSSFLDFRNDNDGIWDFWEFLHCDESCEQRGFFLILLLGCLWSL